MFNFSDKRLGFSKIIELCLNLGIEFCIIYLLSSNYQVLTTRTILKERIETFKPCRTWAAVSKQCIISNVWTATNLGLINVHIYARKKVKLATKKGLSLWFFNNVAKNWFCKKWKTFNFLNNLPCSWELIQLKRK